MDLGDPRRERRALEIAERFAAEPEASLPAAMLDRAMLEALYRHLSSDAVTFRALLEPHVSKTAARVKAVGDVLAVHDTTVCKFSGESRRAGLGAVNISDQGFLAHITLAVLADGSRLPLGVMAAELLVRGARKNTSRRSAKVRVKEEGKESERWARGVRAASSRVSDPSKLIHVADREGDIYPLLAELRASGARFIIRSAQNRRVDVGDLRTHLRDVSQEAPTRYTIDVPLSRRSRASRERLLRSPHRPRDARVATLCVASAAVHLRRPIGLPTPQPKVVPVHLVHVFELGPPPGETPVEWLLLTSEPIDTREQVERIIEGYRARWTIEEYFKAVKTGCAYEARQLESFHTLSNLLAYTLVIAYALLVTRSLIRLDRKLPASEVLSETELQVLRLAAKKPLSKRPDVREAMLAVAALGGHLPNNGPPGWRILSRGWQRLRDYEAGFRMARTCDR